MLSQRTVRRSQCIVNIWGNTSFVLWMEVRGTVRKDTMKYVGAMSTSLQSEVMGSSC